MKYNKSMAQVLAEMQEQQLVEDYIDSVLSLDEEQFNEYYDSLSQEQQEELNEIIGKVAKGLGKIAISPITLPYKVGKAAVKGVARAVTSKPAKAVGRAAGKGAVATGKAAVGGIKKLAKRFTTTGRADAAKKKADAIAKRNDERERLAKEKERIAKERERAKKLKGDQGTDARADVAKQQRALDKEKEVAKKASDAEIDKEKKEALDKEDEPAVKDLIKNLRKGSKTHAKQADDLEKDLKDEFEPLEEIKVGDMVKYVGPTRTGLKKGQIGSVVNKTSSGYQVDGMLMRSGVKHKKQHLKKIKEEVEDLEEFTDKQIERLKKEYEGLRGKEKSVRPERFAQLRKMMRRFPKANLLKLAKADIPILSSGARASLVVNHGMKFSQIPEDFVPYIDVFADDDKELSEQKKGKFKEVDPKVIDRIEKMMRGTRKEKDSIANMLNYFMPPEVVDMVRYKLKIVPKRGKIKF